MSYPLIHSIAKNMKKLKSDLSKHLKIPKCPKVSLRTKLSQLKSQNLTSEQVVEIIIDQWREYAGKIEIFWSELPHHVDEVLAERINMLTRQESELWDREQKLWERENAMVNSEKEKRFDNLFSRLEYMIDRGVTPDVAVEFLKEFSPRPHVLSKD